MKKRKTSIAVGDTVCSCKLQIYAVYQGAAAADGICDQRGFRGCFPGQEAECINTCPACKNNRRWLINREIEHAT